MKEFFSRFMNSLAAKASVLMLALLLTGVGTAFAQSTVRGAVTDERGNPMVGVTVMVVGTTTGTTTDTKGQYSIAVPKNGALEYSYLGMATQKAVVASGITSLDIKLKEDSARLDEVVVIGFGTQKRADVTAAVTQIDGRELLKAPMTNISQGLVGRMAGLIGVQNSGQPGADQSHLTIRGAKTGILYIVDGVPRDINDIDPNDIETVSLLKDGAASAVYGLNAAGGVMIVTTKKGQAGSMNLNYKGSFGASMNTNYPEFLDGPDYAYWYNKALTMDGQKPIFTKDHVKWMKEGTNGWGNTKWFDQIFGTGILQQHSVTATGGTEKLNVFASMGYMNQTGNIKNFNYNRYNMRVNLDAKIARSLTFTMGMSGQIGDRKAPGYSAGGSSGTGVSVGSEPWLSIAEQAAFALPYLPIKQDGVYTASRNQYGNAINPIAATEQSGFSKSQAINIQTNAALTWDIPWVKGLTMKAMGSYDRGQTFGKSFSDPYFMMVATAPNSTSTDITYNREADARFQGQAKPVSSLTDSYSQWARITSQASINYSNKFADLHKVDVMALIETRYLQSNSLSARARDIPYSQLPELDFATDYTQKGAFGSSNASRSAGFVFRAQYNYADRYLAEFSGRYDGSYKFMGNVPGRRWGFFPSASLGWRLSEEKFFTPLRDVVDNLKFRASFGSLGDDRGSAAYAYLSTFSQLKDPTYFGGVAQPGIFTSLVANEILTWERSFSYNAGFDLSMWQGKLGIEFDVFYNYIFDILGPTTGKPDSMGGYFPTYVNNNAQDVKGVDVKLTHRNRIGKDFNYGVTVNMTYANDRWLTYQDLPNTPDYQKRVGKGRYMAMGLISDGLFQSEDEIDNSAWMPGFRPRVGDIKYRDMNGDGVISTNQDAALSGRGQRPKFNGSVNVNLEWRGIVLDVLFVGAAMGDISMAGTYFNSAQDNTIYTRPFKANANAPRYLVEDAWTPENTGATFPRLSVSPPNTNNSYASTFWYRDGKYLRLKSLHLGYTLPKTWMSKIRMQKIKVYVEGQNLLTWSKLPKGFDPEWPDVSNGYYPQQRTIVGGLEISF